MASSNKQQIPARHGTATFVPAGSTIKILDTAGGQVVDTWAFALPSPPTKTSKDQSQSQSQSQAESKHDAKSSESADRDSKGGKDGGKKTSVDKQQAQKTPNKSNEKGDLPTQEEAEDVTNTAGKTPAKQANTWSSYLPSMSLRKPASKQQVADEKETAKNNSKTWSEYLGAGDSLTPYTQKAKSAVSGFASSHYRDPEKSYAQQLSDFSRTPVGAAGISVISGQGYASSLYAGYNAWSGDQQGPPPMEFLSTTHSRMSTMHMDLQTEDVLVSNLLKPMMTVLEDTASGNHDLVMPACSPEQFRVQGVEKWEEHGSCCENLVLALKELNQRAGLEGDKAIGSDVTVNSVPAPIHLFQQTSLSSDGSLEFSDSAQGKKGAYIRLRAERDVVVVMSSCPARHATKLDQSQNKSSGKEDVQDGQFIVEHHEQEDDSVRDSLQKAFKAPSKASASGEKEDKSAAPAAKRNPPKKISRSTSQQQNGGPTPTTGQAKKSSKPRTPLGTKKPLPGQKPSGGAATSDANEQSASVKNVSKKSQSVQDVGGKENATSQTGSGQAEDAAPKKKPRKLAR